MVQMAVERWAMRAERQKAASALPHLCGAVADAAFRRVALG